MLDIGWSELLVIGVVALLVVGPKELPGLLRTIGRYMGMVRRQANEFRAQFNEAIKDTEFDDIRKEVDAIRTGATNSLRDIESAGRVDPVKEIERSYGDKNHKPAFSESELEWMKSDTRTPAERAAAAATRPQAAATSSGVAAAIAPPEPTPATTPAPATPAAPSASDMTAAPSAPDITPAPSAARHDAKAEA